MRVGRGAWLGVTYRRRRGGASNQRICCAIGILEFFHRQPAGEDGLFSPTAGDEVERRAAIF